MRLQKKYKHFSKLTNVFKNFPKKVLKFHRTKWKKLKELILKKKKNLWAIKTVLTTKKWSSYKLKHFRGVVLKNFFDCLLDKAFSMLFLKKLKFLNQKKIKTFDNIIYVLKPQYRIDIFFWHLKFFSSSYQARQMIKNKKITVNGKTIHPNYFLKKGDVISFDSLSYHLQSNFKTFLGNSWNNTKILSFAEIDYYTNTVVILKNYKELTEKNIILYELQSVDIIKLKSFVE